MKIAVIIRLVLSATLLYFSYFETGIITTIVLGLLLLNGEADRLNNTGDAGK